MIYYSSNATKLVHRVPRTLLSTVIISGSQTHHQSGLSQEQLVILTAITTTTNTWSPTVILTAITTTTNIWPVILTAITTTYLIIKISS